MSESGRWYSSQLTGSRHRCILEQRSEYSRNRRVNIGSNKNCFREDPAKDKMVLSEESGRAIFEMCNLELIELKKSSIRCPSCLHNVLEGTFICMCRKLIRPNKDVMNRINEVFEILNAPHYRTSSIVTRGSGCGPNPWQQHHNKARDASRSATKK